MTSSRSTSFEQQPTLDVSSVDNVADAAKPEPTRACDACRKMKIRCTDKENPPCKRCRSMNLECQFSVSTVSRALPDSNDSADGTKSRLDLLEVKMTGINQVVSEMDTKLDNLSSLILQLVPRKGLETPSTTDGSMVDDPPFAQTAEVVTPVLNAEQGETRDTTWSPSPSDVVPPRHSKGSKNRFAPKFAGLVARRAVLSASSSTSSVSPDNQVDWQAPNGTAFQTSPLAASERTNAAAMLGRRQGSVVSLRETLADPDDDPLQSAMEMEPFRELTRKEEEYRLRAEGYEPSAIPGRSMFQPEPNGHGKRRRVELDEDGMEDDWGKSPIREKGDPHRHWMLDPVALGYCSEEEGKTLFMLFFKYAHPFAPVMDHRQDTWDNLRQRSPFCVTAILMVASRARDGCHPPSELTIQCKEQAETMAKLTLFSPIATLETVQALTLMTCWGDQSWRTCCHAMALAVDMRLYRCLPYLHNIRRDGRNAGSSMVERQRQFVVGARVWLSLVKQTYEMAYNHAHPVQFSSPANERTQYARELLEHPLSNVNDSRLVVSVELCEIREGAYWPYVSLASHDRMQLDETLRNVNRKIHTHYEYWINYYHRAGVPSDHFLVKELGSQKAYSIMYTNSYAWYGVHDRNDVILLSKERRQWVGEAMRAAAFLVSSIGSGRQEKDSEFGNHNFHVGIVATARYLIRMCELLPDECDLHQISLDLDKLLRKVATYPVHPLGDILRHTLSKARDLGILPYTSMSEAVSCGPGPQPNDPSPRSISNMISALFPPGIDPFHWKDPGKVISDGTELPHPQSGDLAHPLTDDSTTEGWANDFDLAAWFPMPNGLHETVSGFSGDGFEGDEANWIP